MSTCGDNANLDKLKELQGGLDAKLAGGQAQLDALKADMNSMKAEAESYKPEIPTKESFQQELKALGKENEDFLAFEAKKAELKAKYNTAEADFDATIEKLGMNEFPPTEADIATICENAANVVLDAAGNATVEPEPPKVADVVPPAPVKKEVYVPDTEEINKNLLNHAYNNCRDLWAIQTAGLFLLGKKKNQMYFDLTWPEAWIHLYASGGSDADSLKRFSYTIVDLRARQVTLKAKHKNSKTEAYNFQEQGQELERVYNLLKTLYDRYANAGSFSQAAAESVARQKKKNEELEKELKNLGITS